MSDIARELERVRAELASVNAELEAAKPRELEVLRAKLADAQRTAQKREAEAEALEAEVAPLRAKVQSLLEAVEKGAH
jgi:hypothetical protein